MSVQDEQQLTPREHLEYNLLEYSALRATIRERGTARFCIFAFGIAAWGALAIATAALATAPVATLLPLVVLGGVFEAVYALHIGVERVGRYLQVFYEAAGSGPDPAAASEGRSSRPQWEHAAMSFGRPAGAATIDPLFTTVFLLAAALNLIPALIVGPTQAEVIFVGGAHALFAIRLVVARGAARRQRPIDLARFQQLRVRT